MQYVTQQDMIDRFGEAELIDLTDRDHSAGAIVASVLTPALSDADAEIDSYLQVRYSLPLAHVPKALTRIAADIARYRLYDDGVPDAVKERYQAATKFLKSIATGELTLGPATDGSAPTATNDTTQMQSGARISPYDANSFI